MDKHILMVRGFTFVNQYFFNIVLYKSTSHITHFLNKYGNKLCIRYDGNSDDIQLNRVVFY